MTLLAEPAPSSTNGVSTDVASSGGRRPLSRALMVARLSHLPYRTMRCIAALGAEVIVLGAESAAPLARSRLCKEFIPARAQIDGSGGRELAEELNGLIESKGVDMVFAGDAPSTRSLISVRSLLKAPSFPTPTLEQFDFLNHKPSFGALCEELGVRAPRTLVAQSVQEISVLIAAGGLKGPYIIKPVDMDGGNGVFKVEADDLAKLVGRVFYSPIIVQEYVAGEDIGASVYCREGEVLGFVLHRFDERVYETFFRPDVLADLRKIVRHVGATGILNFDMILRDDGSIWYLECNPRFYYKMWLTMLAGLNFVEMGLREPSRGTAVVCPIRKVRTRPEYLKGFIADLLVRGKLELLSREAFRHYRADPAYTIREALLWYEDPVLKLNRG